MSAPEEIIYKRDDNDFLGTVLTLIKETKGSCATAYYANQYVPMFEMEKISKGENLNYFLTKEHLHKCVEKSANRTLQAIDSYRNTGEYFKSHKYLMLE